MVFVVLLKEIKRRLRAKFKAFTGGCCFDKISDGGLDLHKFQNLSTKSVGKGVYSGVEILREQLSMVFSGDSGLVVVWHFADSSGFTEEI